MGESMGAVATAISCVVRRAGSRSNPSSSATMCTDWRKPRAQRLGHDALARLLGCLAEEHPVADDVGGAVGADVGELLGPHAGDGARQGRDHEREALGDAAGVDARAVQGDAGRPAHRVELGPLVARRVEPAERRDQVLARLEDPGDHVYGRRRSGCRRRSRLRGRGARRRRRGPRSRGGSWPMRVPTSTPSLASLCTQQPASSRSGWASTPSIAARPTLPVAHWITRYATVPPPQVDCAANHRGRPVGRGEGWPLAPSPAPPEETGACYASGTVHETGHDSSHRFGHDAASPTSYGGHENQ